MEYLKIKPCPFCHGESSVDIFTGCKSDQYWVQCDDCDANGPTYYDDRNAAVRDWNKISDLVWSKSEEGGHNGPKV